MVLKEMNSNNNPPELQAGTREQRSHSHWGTTSLPSKSPAQKRVLSKLQPFKATAVNSGCTWDELKYNKWTRLGLSLLQKGKSCFKGREIQHQLVNRRHSVPARTSRQIKNRLCKGSYFRIIARLGWRPKNVLKVFTVLNRPLEDTWKALRKKK